MSTIRRRVSDAPDCDLKAGQALSVSLVGAHGNRSGLLRSSAPATGELSMMILGQIAPRHTMQPDNIALGQV